MDTLELKTIHYNSKLCFKPALTVLKRALDHNHSEGVKELYSGILEYADQNPELYEPIEDLNSLTTHRAWLDKLISTIFPPTLNEGESLHSVSPPFSYKTIYASRLFRMLFIKHGTDELKIVDNETTQEIEHDWLMGAYNLILKKFWHQASNGIVTSVHPYHDHHTGLIRYTELQLDTRYVDVKYTGEHPENPEELYDGYLDDLDSLDKLREVIPLDKFSFEGIVIGRVVDVTEREVISKMKSELLNLNAFSEKEVYIKLEEHVQSLIGLKDIKIGITPFFKINGHYVFSEIHNSNSLLFKHYKALDDKEEVCEHCHDLFINKQKPVIYEKITEEQANDIEYLDFYYDQGYRSLILAPLKHNGDLWGILEIGSDHSGKLKHSHLAKLEVSVPLFTLAIEKSAEALDSQIDKVIKEQFTAVQPSVEWKFTEAAFSYIVQKQHGKEPTPEKIAFEHVYPLYGAIDIRNSSVERSQSIQLDFLEQLQKASEVLIKARNSMNFPLLQEVQFKIDKFINSASDVLMSDEETLIHDFLQNQVVSIFQHLRSTVPVLKKDIDDYFSLLDPKLNMIYHHRKEYEQSITRINDVVSKFIDKEQVNVQQIFPHFFERYVTDGVEFNIYIGQALAPRKKFDELYLKNIKMWQLTTLAKAAKITNQLANELTHPMKTTQLIFAHSTPISIMFRTAERKFDVDGASNVRYEIIKKRIDKAHIKGTNERFTQPGKIAIVYSQAKDAEEYTEYIEFLQNQNLLKPGIEHHDLEEMQGVAGMKGLRVDVQYEEASDSAGSKPELSSTTDDQLLKK